MNVGRGVNSQKDVLEVCAGGKLAILRLPALLGKGIQTEAHCMSSGVEGWKAVDWYCPCGLEYCLEGWWIVTFLEADTSITSNGVFLIRKRVAVQKMSAVASLCV